MKTATKPVVTYTEHNPLRDQQQDATWYTDGSEHTCVATVTLGDKTIYVSVDGIMRVTVDNEHDIRTGNQMIDLGITTDAELFDANEAGRTWWINNAWFDLYDADDHLDCVCDTLNDAIATAIQLLTKGDK